MCGQDDDVRAAVEKNHCETRKLEKWWSVIKKKLRVKINTESVDTKVRREIFFCKILDTVSFVRIEQDHSIFVSREREREHETE